LAFAVVVAVSSVTPAGACPPGPCLKYSHMQPPPNILQAPTLYTRPLRGGLPSFSYRNIAGFLAASPWQPDIPPTPTNVHVIDQRLRFVFAGTAIRTRDTSTRNVLIRRIERRARMILVEVDGDVFELSRCGTPRAPAVCLQRTELELSVVDDPTDDDHFAKPPGQ
jgi:hypothetical protein